ncbi:AAA family ATPase [Pusillimonas sp. SM2304]|uniref:AAA family ATPase n=1 Tax=Pusillimonas sp. SM2304 TaxID=3073241 RepID=UPI0028772005|nr:AAA family ATPase [Pusillimonas sp. SM2304]MDS1141729.1 AAA family ATPase [Pusillimonas sp. SM2304]
MSNVLPIITPESFDMAAYMRESEPKVKVLSPLAWRDALVQSTRAGESSELTGARLPWAKTHDMIRFRGGEMSLWQGMNGHGKSQLVGQVMTGFSAQDEPSCIASFEMKPLANLKRMLRQVAMTATPSESAADRFVKWLDKRMWFYDQMGSVRPEMVYAVIRYCAEQLRVKHFMVDSLMKCVQGEDDYNGQKAFVDQLTSLARDYNIHIHLVHHVRKSENEDRPPGKYDAKGTGAIADLVDNFLTVWRNKPKERAVEIELRKNNCVSEDTAAKPDSMIICDKQRHGDWEGRINLWFNRPSLQYTGDRSGRPLEMIGDLL